jgi:hypothetical protein
MHKKVNSEKIIKIPDKIVAYVSGCSVETVKKVKGNKRRDKYNINGNMQLISEFLETIKQINN